MGVGIGYYSVAGTNSKFDAFPVNSVWSLVSIEPEMQSLLQVTELSIGAGFEVTPELSLGVSWEGHVCIWDLQILEL